MELTNTDPQYWLKNYPAMTESLALRFGGTAQRRAETLAYIAGDYATMKDDDVIGTYIMDALD